jgi:hypothetical protein
MPIVQADQEDTKAPETLAEAVLYMAGGQVVITDGSLAKHCAQALTELHGKQEGDLSNLGMESYQIDLETTLGKWEALRQQGILNIFADKKELVSYLYAVREGDVALSDVVRFVDALNTMPDEQQRKAVLLVQTSGSSAAQPSFLAPMLINEAQAKGVTVVSDLQQVVETYRSRM